ncbi:ribosome biogenesis protein BMS1 homolog [Sitophilus oryzae]|uniref:Ribosome biogenesis protein BMS1 homolog n=1 Tax=Sitophilus oryzae TaxID=7048 RepID=A0A6J2YQY7_SITOR|nr:ribosome biogenesis protein BMS1 homolog [Sitophilus oryzae]
MGQEEPVESKKSHRERNSGRKADKKKNKNDRNKNEELSDKQRNPKAFAFNSAIRAERRFRRKQDIETKKQHIPLVDRTPIEPPPILIAVVGPPKVGKTTVINNLIRLFTRSPLKDIKGPVTIVTGKKRRITLIECNNDINSMIDLAKVCDLALLLCDASFGFEMEIFEFLNICQVHGMPRIMGILTHLDMIKNSKALKNTKKTLKHRFWTEVYSGAKLFYLSGIIHGEYLHNEIKNLGRFISVMKFRPLIWRQSHSYLLGDRYEDLTNQELIRKDPTCDRNISLYGYIRGVPLKKENSVHIAGFGDLKIQDISYLPDPCPLPEELKKRSLVEKEKLVYAPFSGVGGIVYDKDAVYVELAGSHSHNKKNDEDEEENIVSNLIDTKETLDVKMEYSEMQLFTGGEKLTAKDFEEEHDKDSTVAEISKPVNSILKTNTGDDQILNDELEQLRTSNYSEEKIESDGRIRRKVIFQNNESFSETSEDSEEDASDIEEDTLPESVNKNSGIHLKIKNVLNELEDKKKNKENTEDLEDNEDILNDNEDEEYSSNSDSDDDEPDEDMAVKWKDNLLKKAQDAFLDRIAGSQNLMKLVYGVFDLKHKEKEVIEENSDNDSVEDLITRNVTKEQEKIRLEKDTMDLTESALIFPWNTATKDWTTEENKELIINCFVTGKWKDSEDASELLKLDEAEDLEGSDGDMYGDFEDLETGEKHTATPDPNSDTQNQSGNKRKRDSEIDEEASREALAEKKRKLKEKFNSEYDNTEKNTFYDELKLTAEKQAQLNKTVFENLPNEIRVQMEGFRPGMYVRIEFANVPSEFITNFDPTYPLVLGSLNMGEENIGFVNVKIKKHRWYNRILKSNDPLILSLGWRRFQTVPVYSKLEDDLKYRYLKYTPEHLACNAHFWGPITPQATGFLALQSVDSNPQDLKKQGFRIAATGSVQELDKSTQIMKKLKLIGYPLKIYKKTAFIKGMFNSALEVAKFEGARIKTVSGIRGQIKKAINKPEGCFRATFEDKIQLSDVVFCRTWYKVDVPEFYNPVTTLLLPPDMKNRWKGFRTTGEIKREKNIQNTPNTDHLYLPVVREEKPFKPLIIPAKLQKALPYRDKPKHDVKNMEKKKGIERVAVIREPHEQKISSMMKMIKASYQHKQERLKKETKERLEKHREEVSNQEKSKDRKIKQKKKEVMRHRSKAQISQEKRSKR